MKITKIDVLLVESNTTDNKGWAPVLCRIHTDTGLYGDGEASLSFGNAHKAAFGMLQDFAKPLIGMDPLDNEVIWEKLYKSSFWAQNGGPVVFSAISALDTALWDIKGKFFHVPVYKLLGGKMRSSLRCYASQLQFGWDDRKIPAVTVDDYVSNALKAVKEGFDAVKFDFFTFAEDGHRFTAEETTRVVTPKNRDMIRRRLAAVREAVGDHIDIIMENHSYIDAQGAVQLGRMAEEYGVLFFEDPCTPTPKMNKFVSDRISVAISQGERIYSRWGYAPYFEDGSIQMIQPDIGL